MPGDSDDASLSSLYAKLHDRLCSVEALLTNIYTKYYHEQYDDTSREVQRSLRKARTDAYSLYSDYSFIDNKHEYRVRNLINSFFSHLDSIISMNDIMNNEPHFPVTLGADSSKFDCANPAFQVKIQSLLHDKIPEYSDLVIDQMYQVKPSSDLVLRVWLKDRHTDKPVVSVIVKMLGANSVRNEVAEKYGLFYREASFYTSFAEPIRRYTPACHYVSPEESLIILEDAGQAVMGDQLYGYQADEARSVISTLIDFHAFWLNKKPQCFLPQVNDEQIVEIIPEMLAHSWAVTKSALNAENSAKVDAIVEDLIENVKPISDELNVNTTVIHGDLRMENLLFNKMELDSIIDWQLLALGSPMIDVAYFLVQSGCAEERKQVEAEVLERYARTLPCYNGDLSRVKFEYELATKHSLIIPIMGAAWDLQEFEKPRDIVLSAFHRAIDAINYPYNG